MEQTKQLKSRLQGVIGKMLQHVQEDHLTDSYLSVKLPEEEVLKMNDGP